VNNAFNSSTKVKAKLNAVMEDYLLLVCNNSHRHNETGCSMGPTRTQSAYVPKFIVLTLIIIIIKRFTDDQN